MNDQNKISVVMFNMSTHKEWGQGIVNRNRFMFNQLQHDPRIEKILSIDYLPINLKRSLKYFWQNKRYNKLVKRTDKVYSFSTCHSTRSPATLLKVLKGAIKSAGLDNYILWSYLPTFPQAFSQLNAKLTVFETVDDWSLHPAYQNIKTQLRQNYKTIDQSADFVFTVAPSLRALFPSNKEVHWIPNGVDFEHFQKQTEVPPQLVNFKKPLIGYIGTIQSRVDLDLIKYISEQNPDKSIVLIGPIWPDADISKISSLNNVHLIGRIRYEDSPAYLNQFAVGIVPHKNEKFVKTMNPMKIMEYLACGKPVIASAAYGFESLVEFVKISNLPQEFNQLLNQAISEDSNQKVEQRKEAARQNSWDNRYQQIWSHLAQKLN